MIRNNKKEGWKRTLENHHRKNNLLFGFVLISLIILIGAMSFEAIYFDDNNLITSAVIGLGIAPDDNLDLDESITDEKKIVLGEDNSSEIIVTSDLSLAAANNAPSVDSISITPTGPNSSDNLSTVVAYTDVDGDSVNITYGWYKNNIPVATLNMPFNNFSEINISYDFSGSKHHASANHSVATIPGKNGVAVDFGDNLGSYINISNKAMDGLDNFTIMFWIKSTGEGSIGIFSAANSECDNEFLLFKDTILDVYINCSVSNYGTGLDSGNWDHFALVRDYNFGNVTTFLNGAIDNSKIVSAWANKTIKVDPNGLIIAQEQDSVGGGFQTQHWGGQMDELKIYNSTLSWEQIEAIYFAENNGFGANVTSYTETTDGETWKVDAVAIDAKGLNGTISTSATVTVADLACGDTISSTTTLTRDLSGCSGNGITIGANNIILNCAGYQIDGDGGANDNGVLNTGVYSNVTVKNCKVKNFGKSIIFQHSHNSTIWNNTIGHVNLTTSFGGGINFSNCTQANISNNIITNITGESVSNPFGITYSEFKGDGATSLIISDSVIFSNNITRIYGKDNLNPLAINLGDSNLLSIGGLKVDGNVIENINCTSAGGGTACQLVGSIGIKVNSGTSVNLTNNNISYVDTGVLPDQFGLRLTNNIFNFGTYGISTFFQGSGTRFNHSWLENNTFQDLTQGINLLENTNNNTFLNNNFSNILQFSIRDDTFASINNTLIYNNSVAEIKWGKSNITTNITLGVNSSDLYLENGTIGLINNANALKLNDTAQIKFIGLAYSSTPQLLKDGVRCDDGNSCNISYDSSNGILLANISSFSNYTLQASLGCGDIISVNTNLEADLNGCTGNGLEIGASNIILDCSNYQLDGDGGVTDYGILNTGVYSNVTVKNCVIKNFGKSIIFQHSHNSTIWNNTVGHVNFTTSSGGGINFTNCTQANISNNVIANITGSAIFNPYGITFAEFKGDSPSANSVSDSVIFSNNITRIYGKDNFNPLAIHLGDSSLLTLAGLKVDGNIVENINCTSAAATTACQIVGGVGIKVDSGTSVNITNNNLSYIGTGILPDQFGLRIINNYFSRGTYGIYPFFQASATRFNHSWIENNTFYELSIGVYLLENTNNNTFLNNNFSNNLQFAILDFSSSTTNNSLIYNNSVGEIRWSKSNISTNITLGVNSSTLYLENGTIGLINNVNTLKLNDTAQIKFIG